MAPQRSIWCEEGEVFIVDQTRLPGELKILHIQTVGEMFEAIQSLRIRGAPAIGIAAAFGVWIAVKHAGEFDSIPTRQLVENACKYLETSRPTAVNLFWALDRVRDVVKALGPGATKAQVKQRLLEEAQLMIDEDNAVCRAIGLAGADLIPDGGTILTHCNTGGLATAQYGTALACVYMAVHEKGKSVRVLADETRPLLQGARLTTWELQQAGIPVTLICDSMAGWLMKQGKVDLVIVGADRVTRHGDFANKIGTYSVARLARCHSVPFYVAVPFSSIDTALTSGDQIPIEERRPDEVTSVLGTRIAPEGVDVYNPAFDVTPAEFVDGFITEKGIFRTPYDFAAA